MAALASSSVIAANFLFAADDVRQTTSEIRGCRMSTNSACSSSYRSSFQNSTAGSGIEHPWLHTGRPLAWRRRRSGDGSGVCGHYSGVVKACLEEGGQVVTPAVPAGSELSNPSPEMLLQMQLQMKLATVREDYAEAARLRDVVKALQGEDPVVRLKALMEKAISEERYIDAAGYRDELIKVSPQRVDFGLQCFSDTTTKGIRVRVRSIYVKDRSSPCKQQYYFAYRIRISNEALQSVQLLSRHWIITDANGKVEEVRGLGVIGEQPVLLPGTSFEYTSACPLGTSTGRMEGMYQMKYPDQNSIATFDVEIGPFSLSIGDDELID